MNQFTKETLCLIAENEEISRDIVSRIDRILQNHSGMGVKTLEFVDSNYSKLFFCHHDLDRWLQKIVKRGIEELKLSLERREPMYNFPCSLLSDEIGGSLRYLQLVCCNFHPTSRLGCLRSLTILKLTTVSITENELVSSFQFCRFGSVGTLLLPWDYSPENTLHAAARLPTRVIMHRATSIREQSSKYIQCLLSR
jgi:hypothetical protein